MRTSMMMLGRLVVAVSLALSACDRGAPTIESVKEDEGSVRAANNAATIAERVPPIGAKIKGSDKALANAAAPQPEGKSPADSANQGGCDCDQGEECNGAAKQDPKETEIVDIQVGNAPVRGDADAPVTIVVFTDFECPFCAKAEQNLRAIEKEYGRNVRVAYKSYPLPFHEHAGLAAKAALAAHQQGKFFEYRDALFAHQNALGRAELLQYASDLGLDSNRFERDLENKSLDATIAAEQAEANRLEVHGTPTFFVNGRRIAGAQPIAAFRTQIEAALTQR